MRIVRSCWAGVLGPCATGFEVSSSTRIFSFNCATRPLRYSISLEDTIIRQ